MTVEGVAKASDHVVIVPNLPKSAVKPFADITKSYLTAKMASFEPGTYRETTSGDSLSVGFNFGMLLSLLGESTGNATIETKISIGTQGVVVDFSTPAGTDSRTLRAKGQLVDDLELVATAFMMKAKRNSIHFVLASDKPKDAGPSWSSDGLGKEPLKRIFAGNSTNLFLVLLTVSLLLLFVFGAYAITAVLAVQVASLYYADRIALLIGDVKPTAESPFVTVVSVPTVPQTADNLRRAGKRHLARMRKELETAVQASQPGDYETRKAVQEVLSGNRIVFSPDEVRIAKKDVFDLVRQAAVRFGLPSPKITIINAYFDNASATGISPSKSSIAITAGALEDLDDGELRSVVGHELGHIKGRDPIILFVATTLMIFGGLYLWFPLIEYLGILYFLLAFGVIFAVGKILETRADTISATLLEARILAKSLAVIGYPQLYREKRSASARLFDWLIFDSHPPMYFRVNRLSRISGAGDRVKHSLVASLRDVTEGFLKALIGRE